MFGPKSAFKIFVISHLLVSTTVQSVWPEIGFQDFCILLPSTSYHGSLCLARDRLSRFSQFLTSQIVPLFSVFGRSNVFGPRSAFKVFAIFASYLIRHLSLARDRPSRFLPILTSSLVGPCPGPGALLANLEVRLGSVP